MDRRKMVATVATITSDAEAAIILNGSDFNVSGLFINRLIIFTSGSELLSSDGSGNNCRLFFYFSFTSLICHANTPQDVLDVVVFHHAAHTANTKF